MEEFRNPDVDIRKFRDYSMNPQHPENGDKHEAFEELGYRLVTAEERESAATDVVRQLRIALTEKKWVVSERRSSKEGPRFRIDSEITGPNGRKGTLVTVWLQERESESLRLITNYVKVHPHEES